MSDFAYDQGAALNEVHTDNLGNELIAYKCTKINDDGTKVFKEKRVSITGLSVDEKTDALTKLKEAVLAL